MKDLNHRPRIYRFGNSQVFWIYAGATYKGQEPISLSIRNSTALKKLYQFLPAATKNLLSFNFWFIQVIKDSN